MRVLKTSIVLLASAGLIASAACASVAGGSTPDKSQATAGESQAAAGNSATAAKFGVFLPLTGENAENGKQIKDGLELAADQYNQAGHKFTIELEIRDDRGEPKTATNIAREFAEDDDIIGAIGSFTSTAAMAAAPVFEQAGIPQLAPTSSHPKFTTMSKYAFRGVLMQNIEAKDTAEHTAKVLHKTSAAILYRQDDWGQVAEAAFREGFEANGGTIVDSQAVPPETKDFRTIVTSLKNKGVDTLYLALHYSDASVLAQQMQASGWKPLVVSASPLYSQDLIDLAGASAVEGWTLPTTFYAESDDPKVRTFVEEYTKRAGHEPNAFGAIGFDSLVVLGSALDAIDQVGTAGRTALGDAIYNVTIEGVTGETKYDAEGNVTKTETWLEIHDGKFVPAQ
jgi:branched-chain amino acid transport system substrate-binding protein